LPEWLTVCRTPLRHTEAFIFSVDDNSALGKTQNFVLWGKMATVLDSFRLRTRVPLEIFCTTSLLLAFCIPAMYTPQSARFELCGHVYAKPPVQFYYMIFCVCISILVWKFMATFYRFISCFYWGDFAVLEPTALFYSSVPLAALYVHRWHMVVQVLMAPVSLVCLCVSGAWCLGPYLPSCFLMFGGIGAVQTLNIFLIVGNALTRNTRPKWYALITRFFAVLATDGEYRNLKLENNEWSTITTQDATVSEIFQTQTCGAIIDVGDNRTLFVPGSGDFCVSGPTPMLSLRMKFSEYTPVKLDKSWNFRLIPAKVPYALVWFGIYGMIREMGGYRDANEIDRCVIWLLLVSAVTEGIIWLFPGPAVVVEADT